MSFQKRKKPGTKDRLSDVEHPECPEFIYHENKQGFLKEWLILGLG